MQESKRAREQESNRAREQEGKRECEDVKLWRCEDVRMWRCEDVKMWRWEDVKMRRCEDEKMWRWEACEDEKMWRCEDVKMWGCEDVKMWGFEDVKMWRCENVWQTPTIRRTLRPDALGNYLTGTFYAGTFREWSISSLVISSSQQPPTTHPFPYVKRTSKLLLGLPHYISVSSPKLGGMTQRMGLLCFHTSQRNASLDEVGLQSSTPHPGRLHISLCPHLNHLFKSH